MTVGRLMTESDVSPDKRRTRFFVQGGILALLIVGIYHETFVSLWRVWEHNPNYSHGFLIPGVTAVLIWLKRKALREEAIRPSALGLPIVAMGIVLQMAGLRGDIVIFQGNSLLLVLFGLVLHFAGTGWFRQMAFPIFYLAFMNPFPPIFQNEVSFRLKQLAAAGAATVSGWLGILIQRDGMSLFLPTGVMRIENACSGMQSLISLMALGALFAYFARGDIVRRVLLFLASIPIAVIVNIIRISALCIVGNAAGVEVATGLFHDVSGFVLFGVGFVLLSGTRRLLRC